MNGSDERPYPRENGVVAGDRREGEDDAATDGGGAVGVEDAEEPLQVADGGFEVKEELAEVGGGDDVDDAAEDAAAVALAD